MDDFEDYTAVFFQECDELLDDLEERLSALAGGSDDPEVIHAAFRAVHSIKGGADAFGYRELVTFAHVFEATMDAIRGDRLSPTPEVCECLVRGRDVLCDLVDRSRSGETSALPVAQAMIDELATLTGAAPAGTDAWKPEAAQPEAESSADPEEQPDDHPAEKSYRIHFEPGPDFVASGHDPLRLIQALKALGGARVMVTGEIPPLDTLDPGVCPLAWDIELTTEADLDEVNAFFDIYLATAMIEIEQIDAESGSLPENASPQSDAPPLAAQASPAGEATAAEPAPAKAGPQSATATNKAPRTLRVDLERVDRLVNMVGEIVITQAAMAQTLADHETTNLELGHAIDAMSRQIRELQESVMAIRAQPVKAVFSRMARLVRDLAQQLGKDVRTEILGEHTEIDTTVIEELAEPLIHMVRNALDHGVELPDDRAAAGKPRQGTISIAAEHRGERVVISIADDGRGIDRDRVLAKAIERGVVEPGQDPSPEEIDQLIFHPGLSTTEIVSNVSGRGVGMDVVKRNINALGGRVHLENHPGRGARITITLPLSLAVLDGMTIAVGDQRFVIPLGAVVEALTLADAAPRRLPSGDRVMMRRDEYLPLVSVRSALGVSGSAESEQLVVIVDADSDARMGLLVDELIGQRQVVLKSLEANYRSIQGVSGATILSDGRAAMILDVAGLGALTSNQGVMTGSEISNSNAARTEYMQ
jgi:two-component system chemotaxis sensor kinase CheA